MQIKQYYSHFIKQIQKPSILSLILLDCILLPLALVTSILLRLGGSWDPHLNGYLWIFLALPVWTIPIFITMGLYNAVIKYIDEKIIVIVIVGVSFSVGILIAVIKHNHMYAFPTTAIIIFWVFALAYIGGTRVMLRGIYRNNQNHTKINIGIYGAGSAGGQLSMLLQMGHEYNPVAFFDNNKKLWGDSIRGITIYNPQDIRKCINKYKITQILLAMPKANIKKRQEIINMLEPFAVQIKTIPSMGELIRGDVKINTIKEIDIKELLEREPIPPEESLIKKNIYNKIVLVTGAGGSIGGELSRQIACIHPAKLILLDISEYGLYNITKELHAIYPNVHIVDILGDITNEIFINQLFDTLSIETIYHAAAYKHVPIVELNPFTSIYNNVFGTSIIAHAALQHKCEIMVLISTDKAVRPTNIMGASKRISELILQSLHAISTHTIFTMVRFGNVLGSSGSVVPLFKEQINSGGPVTVTHPDVVRYFMTIQEASTLVIQAGNMAIGGDVFILDMGEQIKIIDLATKMIHLSGFNIKNEENPDGDVEIKFTGLRPGEKLYEELLVTESSQPTTHPKILKAHENYIPYENLMDKLNICKNAINQFDYDTIIDILHQLVIDYTQSNTKIHVHSSSLK